QFCCKIFRLLDREPAVEQVQCLNWRRRFTAARGALPSVGAIECSESRICLTSDFVCIDHPAKSFTGERFDRCEPRQSTALFEKEIAAAAHFQVQLAVHGEHAVSNRFAFE